jgi:hypothetical protein
MPRPKIVAVIKKLKTNSTNLSNGGKTPSRKQSNSLPIVTICAMLLLPQVIDYLSHNGKINYPSILSKEGAKAFFSKMSYAIWTHVSIAGGVFMLHQCGKWRGNFSNFYRSPGGWCAQFREMLTIQNNCKNLVLLTISFILLIINLVPAT